MIDAWQEATTSECAIARSCNEATCRAARAVRFVAPLPCGETASPAEFEVDSVVWTVR